jgi:curved DNA-binding protein CbpA
VTKELVEKRYKVRAKILHPDVGGTENEMTLLNQARDAALKEVL